MRQPYCGPDRRKAERASESPKPACPECGCDRSVVIDVPGITSAEPTAYRRMRECYECYHHWPTWESNEPPRKPISGVAPSA